MAEKESNHARIIYLISGFVNGNLTRSEQEELDFWRNESPENASLFKELINPGYRSAAIANWNISDTETSLQSLKNKRDTNSHRKLLWWPYAAAVAVVISIGVYYQQLQPKQPVIQVAVNHDVAPGKNKAVLTLSNGKKIDLNGAVKGTLAEQSGITVSKIVEGVLAYAATTKESNDGAEIDSYNTIDIPKGGKYQVILPDGTKVWLNSASSLSYPVRFTGAERVVKLSGEGYFEVAHNAKMPFKVRTANQEVEVLGTHFNINSYADEEKTITTLLEGSVRVKANKDLQMRVKVLKPGQQTILSGTSIVVQTADTESAVGWRDDLFLFHGTNMKTIMRQLARWYDVEVDMVSIPDNQFYGEISRNVKLSQVLGMMESTSQIKFKIEGRRIMLK